MSTPANVFTLKTRAFHPPLVVAWDQESREGPDILDRPLLVWGADVDDVDVFGGFQDTSKGSVGKAMTDAIQIARDIVNTPGGAINYHDAYAKRVAVFATQYGTLWGDIPGTPVSLDPEERIVAGTLRDWYNELLDLLDGVELKKAIVGNRGDRTLRKRLVPDETGERVYYKMHSKRLLKLASKGETVTIQRPGRATEKLEMWTIAHGTSETFAWATLSTLLTVKLNGHINVGLHPLDKTSVAITPSGILPTLFARVWLDTLKGANIDGMRLVRTCEYPGCDEELSADPRQQYCRDAHRKADERRRKRLIQGQD